MVKRRKGILHKENNLYATVQFHKSLTLYADLCSQQIL